MPNTRFEVPTWDEIYAMLLKQAERISEDPFKPDVIVSDVKMGQMDGFQFFEALKKLPEFSKTPVIFLTIMDDRSSVERATKLGASGYITKPFDVEELHQKIREVMSGKP